MKFARFASLVLALVALEGCNDGGSTSTSPTPTVQTAGQFQIFASINHGTSFHCADADYAFPELATCAVDVTIRESSGSTGGNIDFIKILFSPQGQSEFGSSQIINFAGTNRVEAGQQVGPFPLAVEGAGVTVNRPASVRVQITDDTGRRHTMDADL